MIPMKEEELITINGGDDNLLYRIGYGVGYGVYYLLKGASYIQPSAFEIMNKSREEERNRELLLQGWT
ncbi:lactococcin G-alpha/enterocin 1071A family bacteriocin [Thermoanaerobacter sp. A7A]|jgi:hypothetical protein|uniref:lactococcin G-alpha/enterocin 1071A family bacteriocin n=1 Tax=Thermoanaerobacter sp. A7A TaxID=1350366 RepID=UPI0004185165|nr:lactococcin G-alpha/enterocin 1071A family bacteriocin [Thermoanaerobacter sp. A7A]